MIAFDDALLLKLDSTCDIIGFPGKTGQEVKILPKPYAERTPFAKQLEKDIPLPDNSMDYIMSIAVIHHLSTPERRLQSLMEMNRLLKPGGKALIYVWAFEQPKFKNELEQDVMVKWSLQKKYNTENQQDDILNRYYHLFREKELEDMIDKIDGLTIIENGNQCHNWFCIIQKTN